MNEVNIVMNSIDRATHFVDIVSKYDENMELIRDSYDVDAKSILGIFSMDLLRPLTLRVDASADRFKAIYNEIKEYVVQGNQNANYL